MTEHSLQARHIISIDDLEQTDIIRILDVAEKMKIGMQQGHSFSALRGKILANCFYEPSTRTRLSFEAAAKRLGGDVIGFSESSVSSAGKGESLADSMRILSAYADCIVLRHPKEGAARLAADVATVPVINAGDGANQHPTQTLLDLFSIRETQKRLTDLHIALCGDLKYGRTVHSLAQAMAGFGGRFYLICPEALMLPKAYTELWKQSGVRFSFHRHISEVIEKVDIIYATRLQRERLAAIEDGMVISACHLHAAMLKQAKPEMKILHPLPRVNEIATDVDTTPHAYYFQQAENGLYVRMALLTLLAGVAEEI